MNRFKLPENVNFLISLLNENGHRADAVGGCVRDFILGKVPSDYDITTDAKPEQMKRIFSKMHTVETGIKHGTLTVIFGKEPYEITTYRRDGDYIDHRHPEEVTFTEKLADDLSRRDFTMNAICYNEKDGFTDLFSGIQDIKNSIVRCVGDAERRFEEDALRILRAIRFSSVLGFDIEQKTALAANKKRKLISSVSGERIAVEWKKLLAGVGAYKVISQYSDIIKEFLVLDKIVLPKETVFDNCDERNRELLLFAKSSDSPLDAFLASAERMKYDNKRIKYGSAVLEYTFSSETNLQTESGIKRLLSELGEECALGVIDTSIALDRCGIEASDKYYRILSRNDAYRFSHLKISGNDLMQLGFRGKEIGDILSTLLLFVMDELVENDRDTLILEALKLKDENK